MNDLEWRKIKEVFALAVEQPKELRGDFLRDACGGDAALREEVESLLATADEPEVFIERSEYGIAALLKSDSPNYAGRKFGHYKIISEIGRGGMGAVFLAERSDGAFEQKVALKIIRRSFPDAALEQRFVRERRILASLNHPHIAKLLDGGVSETGELFLAMEYIAGETLTDFVGSHELSIEARLILFLKICLAVSYSHRNLIVHRDLKPSNIIVTEDGDPKLLDFGLAKIIESAEFPDQNQTQTMFRAFTPAYASPEQILGKNITTASDVYSLGVILYELLTGEKPFEFEGKSLDEILETLNFDEPPRPSAIRHSRFKIQDSRFKIQDSRFKIQDSRFKIQDQKSEIRNLKSLAGDLDNIILKALQKEPERRYKSVEALANDIERHLNGLPITARPKTLAYRASRFYKRNKIAVSATALVILALISGLVLTLRQTKIANLERDRAEQRFSDVRKISNSLLFELSPKLEYLSGSTEAREILVSRALEYLDSLAAESQNDAALQSELASAYEKIGDLQGNPTNPNLIDLDAAIKSYEKANQMRRTAFEANQNDAEAARKLAENYRVLGNIDSQAGEIEASAKNTNAALGIYEKLVAENPASNDLQFSLAKVNYDCGLNLQANKKHSESFAYFEKAKNLLGRR